LLSHDLALSASLSLGRKASHWRETNANEDRISQLHKPLAAPELETELATQCETLAKFLLVRGLLGAWEPGARVQ
jgi:hypothetical protein